MTPDEDRSTLEPMSGGLRVDNGFSADVAAGDVPTLAPTTSIAPAIVHSRATRIAKRTLDLVIALVTMVLALPLFLLIALLIKTSSSGPVFFTQTRVGRNGRTFTLIKFRTMLPGTHDETLSDPSQRQRYVANGYKLPPDSRRITGVGRILRKSSLDELPQLLNVLAGQMSVVGVRPLVRDEFAARSARDRELYASLRPGLTGLWQVEGRSKLLTSTRLELDREYVETCNTWRDIKILVRTPLAVLRTSEAH